MPMGADVPMNYHEDPRHIDVLAERHHTPCRWADFADSVDLRGLLGPYTVGRSAKLALFVPPTSLGPLPLITLPMGPFCRPEKPHAGDPRPPAPKPAPMGQFGRFCRSERPLDHRKKRFDGQDCPSLILSSFTFLLP